MKKILLIGLVAVLAGCHNDKSVPDLQCMDLKEGKAFETKWLSTKRLVGDKFMFSIQIPETQQERVLEVDRNTLNGVYQVTNFITHESVHYSLVECK